MLFFIFKLSRNWHDICIWMKFMFVSRFCLKARKKKFRYVLRSARGKLIPLKNWYIILKQKFWPKFTLLTNWPSYTSWHKKEARDEFMSEFVPSMSLLKFYHTFPSLFHEIKKPHSSILNVQSASKSKESFSSTHLSPTAPLFWRIDIL